MEKSNIVSWLRAQGKYTQTDLMYLYELKEQKSLEFKLLKYSLGGNKINLKLLIKVNMQQKVN